MVFFHGGGSIRLPNVPEPVSSSSSGLARIASRHRQSAPPPSRAGPGAVPQRRGDQARFAALAPSLGSETWSWNATDIGHDPAHNVLQSLSSSHPAVVVTIPGQEARSSGRSSGSSSGVGRSSGLPEGLLKLADPAAPVQLPLPGSIPPGVLDNRELDKLISTLGRNKATWRRALVLNEWLQDSGHALDDRLCTTLIRVCAEHGQAVAALAVYEWMRAPRSAGGTDLLPTVYTYTAAMRAALSAGLLDRALAVWEDAKAANCPPDCRLCITFIEVCSRKGLVDQALAMYARMKTAPPGSRMIPTVHAYTASMRAATEGGRWQQALSIWGDMRVAKVGATGHAYAAAMSACAAGSDWQRAAALFEDMCSEGIKPDVVSCTALITALGAAGQWQRAEQVVEWMRGVGLRPNVRTYTALLSALANAQQWDKAMELLSDMQSERGGGVAPNAYTYSALLKALGEHGEWQRAEAVFLELEGKIKAAAAAAAVGTAIGGWAGEGTGHAVARGSSSSSGGRLGVRGAERRKGEDPVVDEEVAGVGVWRWQGLIQRPQSSTGMSPRVSSSSDSEANAPGSSNHGQQGGSASSSTWSSPAQLNGLDLQLQQQAAGSSSLSLSSSNRSTSQQAEPPLLLRPQQHQQQQLGHFGPVGSSSGAALLQKQQQHWVAGAGSLGSVLLPLPSRGQSSSSSSSSSGGPTGPLVNEVVCGALMLAYERGGRWEEAVRVLPRAQALGIKPNAIMYVTAISGAGKAGRVEVAEALFSEALAQGLADGVLYETLIGVQGTAGNAARAEALFRAMVQAGYRPRDYAYCGLIAAHGLSGNLAAALRVRQRIQRDKGFPSVHVYNALIAACERAGQFDKGLELLRGMARVGVEGNALTAQLKHSIGRKGAAEVETAQLTAAALSAAVAAAGTLLIRSGMF